MTIMRAFIFIVFLDLICLGLVSSSSLNSNACFGYTNIGDSRRSIQYKYNPDIAESLCDYELVEGRWYVFNTTRFAKIPEKETVDFNFCGSYSPIFIKTRIGETYHSEAQRNPGHIVLAPTCSNYIDLVGCDWSEQIQIQYCSAGNFFAYWLQRPIGCPMAYCTDDEMPCPPGDIWDEDLQMCKAGYPAMGQPQFIGPYVTDSRTMQVCPGEEHVTVERFAFDCVVGYDQQVVDDGARFEIFLTVDEVPMGQVVHITSLKPKHTFYEDELQGHLGKSIGCQVVAYNVQSPDIRSPPRTSNSYWIGIYGEAITIDRDKTRSSQVRTVDLLSTVPITCYHCRISSMNTCECCRNGCVYEYELAMENGNMVQEGTCLVEVTNSSISGDGPFRVGNVQISVFDDPRVRGTTTFYMKFKNKPNIACFANIGGRLWDNYQINSLGIYVKESSYNPLKCVSVTDPHITDISNQRRDNYLIGDFIMAKVYDTDNGLYMEIQTRQFSCGHNKRFSCNCAVIVREGNSMLGIDGCVNGGFEPNKIKQIRYLRTINDDGSTLEEGTTLHRDDSGNNYFITMKSGLQVKVESGNFMNIYVTFPKEYNKTNIYGMCNWPTYSNGEEYRVEDSNSLFVRNPPACLLWESLTEGALPCKCVEDAVNDKIICDDRDALTIMTPHTVAAQWTTTFQCRHDIKSREIIKTLNMNGFYPAFIEASTDKSDDMIDTSEVFYDFEYDKEAGKNSTISWPSASGITESQARSACTNALRSSKAYTECQGMFDEDMLVENCAMDIFAMDDLAYADNYLSPLESICLDNSIVAANVSNIDELQNDAKYTSIATNVCPSQCKGRGACVNGLCMCNAGYIGADCAVNSNEPPSITSIYNNGTCDLTKKYCASITVYADNMYSAPQLQCRFTAVPLISNGKRNSAVYFTNATFVNPHQLNCPTPPIKVGMLYSYQLAITNDGVLFSSELPYVIYDPNCVKQEGTIWIQKTATCLHNDMCYTQEQRQSDDNCLVCSSDYMNVNKWTDTTRWQDWTACSRSCDMGVEERHYGCSGVSYDVELKSCHLQDCITQPEYELEGVQLTFHQGDSLLKSIYQSDKLFEEIAKTVNDYCKKFTEECCPEFNEEAVNAIDITTDWLTYFDVGDPHINVNIFLMRILVTTEQANLEILCGLQNQGVTFKMADIPLFVRSEAVVNAVTLGKSHIEQALGVTIDAIN